MKRLDFKRASNWQKGMMPGALGSQESADRVRLSVVRFVFLALVLVVIVRLVGLQVVAGGEMRQRSETNRIYQRRVPAPRGVVMDRNGVSLVVNRPVYKLLTGDDGKLAPKFESISREEALKLEGEGDERVVYDVGRTYPYSLVVAHVLGYVGEASESEVGEGYELGDLVGKTGIEKQYEQVLLGGAGSELIEVDAGGEVIRRVGEIEPVVGSDVVLGLDLGLQEILHKELEGRVGAAVATDPVSGEVLAMVSAPAFDNNLFSGGEEEREEELEKVLVDETKPLLNRVVGGIYPPGSVFKVVPAVAGLEEGVIEPWTSVEDEGEIRINEYRYGNWYFDKYGKTEGLVDLVTGIKRSNDIYFYKLGEWLGVDKLSQWARNFGLGSVTGIDLPGEVSGLVPDPSWKQRVRGENWFLGNTYHMAIGQGDLLATPIQLNQMMAVVAARGKWCKPKLVKSVAGDEKQEVSCRQLNISEESLDVVREGLVAACAEGGTAAVFFDYDLGVYGGDYSGEGRRRVACKTGTAEFFDPDDKTHAWFSVFAPAERPEIMLTVLVEAGGEGSEVAAPIARRALEYWFEKSGERF